MLYGIKLCYFEVQSFFIFCYGIPKFWQGADLLPRLPYYYGG